MKFEFDFAAAYETEQADVKMTASNVLSHFGCCQCCVVQRFEDETEAKMIVSDVVIGRWGPQRIPPFQLVKDGPFYVVFWSRGRPFDPYQDRDMLYESRTIAGQGPKMFLSQDYKNIIMEIFAAVIIYMRITRVRCIVDLKSLYIDDHTDAGTSFMRSCEGWDYDWPTSAEFMRYYLPGMDKDLYEINAPEKLRKLFEEINNKSNIADGPKEEFKLFMELFTLERIRSIFSNVIFASKAHRIKLMDVFYKLAVKKKETSGKWLIRAFGENWRLKLTSHPDIKLFFADDSPSIKRRMLNFDIDMSRCISMIQKLYSDFESKKRQFGATCIIENIEQLVEVVHDIFPHHIAVLARWASEEKILLPSCEPEHILGNIDEDLEKPREEMMNRLTSNSACRRVDREWCL